MSPEKQQLAIAKACGYHWSERKHDTGWKRSDGTCGGPPDYLNDLNAMHEAEKILGHTVSKRGGVSQQSSYSMHLDCVLVPADRFGDRGQASTFWIAHATAAQRAEAFLKTLNLWTDD